MTQKDDSEVLTLPDQPFEQQIEWGIPVSRSGDTITVPPELRVKLKPHGHQQAKVYWFKKQAEPTDEFEIEFKCCSPFEEGKIFSTKGPQKVTICPNAIPGKRYPYVVRLKGNPKIMLDPTIVVEDPDPKD